MKKSLVAALILGLGLSVGGSAARAAHGHYVNGVEGIKAGSLPPPGMYFRMYNVFYESNSLRDNRGDEVGDLSLNVFANVYRFIHSTDIDILGGNWVYDIVVPIANTHMSLKDTPLEFSENAFGLGDVTVEPFILAWHGDRWDAAFGLGFYAPTGRIDGDHLVNAGKGFWTSMTTFGGTWYFDRAKTWSASFLARHQTHWKQQDTDITFGDDLSFEWGVGRNIAQKLDVGAAGYCHWQLERDKLPFGLKPGDKERVFAAGPEIGYTHAPWGVNITLRSLWEFGARNREQGNVSTLVLTKFF